jgi:hypothetical protein
MGSDLVYSILSQNGTLIRPASTRFVIAVARLFLESICAGRSLWRLDLWRLDLVMRFQHTNVGCLAGFV